MYLCDPDAYACGWMGNIHRLSEMTRWVVSSPFSFWPIKLNLLRIIYLFLSFLWLPLLIENILIKFPVRSETKKQRKSSFVFLSISHTFLISSHPFLLNPFHKNLGRLGLSVSAGRLCNASPKILRQFVLVNANINHNR